MDFIHRLRTKIGDFWWYSLLVFLAARSGDLIQAFIGLWLVPHYVPQSELGAVLPLVQISTVICIPISILLTPLMKFLNTYATNGEYGKLKRLLQVAFTGSVILFVITFFVARYVMPAIFDRMRVPEGMLGILIIFTGLLTSISPIFNNALQALKKFRTMVIVNAIGAPLRLIVLLVTMPIRALSGYMLGQMTPSAINMVGAFWGLRKELGKDIKAMPFWREDGKAMVRYTWPIAVNVAIGMILVGWQALLIRQRLPDIESAAYYMISRLAEVGCYFGMSLVVVMFPLAAEAEVNGKPQPHLLRNLLGGSALAGGVFVLFYALWGRSILGIVPAWASYSVYSKQLVVLTAVMTMRVVIGNFCSYEMAQSRFGYFLWTIPVSILETVGLAVLTGYGFFRGVLPAGVVDWMASIRADRLDFFLWWFLAFAFAQCSCMLFHMWLRARPAR